MKRLNKVLAVFLGILMVLSIMPMTAFAENTSGVLQSGACGDNVTYTLYNNGELVISGEGEMVYHEAYDMLPWYSVRYQIKTVRIEHGITTIRHHAFKECSYLTSVSIPDSVTEIGMDAFRRCSRLTNIVIPANVTLIGDNAFENSNNIRSITVDENNMYYSSDSYGVLYNKDKTELIRYPAANISTEYIIPDGVTKVHDYAFSWCRYLKSIEIPDSVLSFDDGDSVFTGCKSLESIVIPNGVTAIGANMFEQCFALKNIVIPDSVTFIKEMAFVDCSSLTNITIPNGVTKITMGAFYECTSLKNIVIPDNVTYIDSSAFDRCNALTTVTIPNGVTYIGDDAFGSCKSITDVYFMGTEAEWNAINFDVRNDDLLNANIHFLGHEHKYTSAITKPATCTENGEMTYTCNCGDTYTEIINAIGHKSETVKGYAATCTKDGLTDGEKCSVCGETLKEQTVIETTGHHYTDKVTKEPTCSAEGVKTYTCSVCGDSYTEVIPATGNHTWITVAAIEPTCENHGYTEGKACAVCGYIESVRKEIAPLGHDFGAWTVTKEATCYQQGEKTRTCERCGKTEINYTPIAPDKHTDANHDGICDDCLEKVEINCNCYCHRPSKLSKIIWKIMRVFWKLFGGDNLRYCECGRAHW